VPLTERARILPASCWPVKDRQETNLPMHTCYIGAPDCRVYIMRLRRGRLSKL